MSFNLSEAHQFLCQIDPAATQFTFQTFDDTEQKRGYLARMFHGPLDRYAAELQDLNNQGAGVYVTINKTDLTGRKVQNIVGVRAVFADFDGSDPRSAFNDECRPSMVVMTSPKKFHVYWLVDDLELTDFNPIQKAISSKFSSDPKPCDLPRVMRLPGFNHMKSGAPYPVTLHLGAGGRYSGSQILTAFPAAPLVASMPVPSPIVLTSSEATATKLAAELAEITQKYPSKGRHSLALKLGFDCRRAGLDLVGAETASAIYVRLARTTNSDGEHDPLDLDAIKAAVVNAYKDGKDVSPAKVTGSPDPVLITASDLLNKQFPELRWVVPDIMPEGTYLLAGKPKMGKSWMALDIAIAVATGESVLNGKAVQQGEVLYLGLEDNARRMKDRIQTIMKGRSMNGPIDMLVCATDWARGDDAIRKISDWLDEHPQARLVVIDTLAKVRPEPGRNSNQYSDDYKAGDAVKALSDKYRVSVLIITHVRKMHSDDPLEMISGTLGLTGGVDGAMVLSRVRGNNNATLFVTGRDIADEKDYAVTWDKSRAMWTIIGNAAEVRVSDERRTILDALKLHGPMTAREVSDAVDAKFDNIRKLLNKMHADQEIDQLPGRPKKYTLPLNSYAPAVAYQMVADHMVPSIPMIPFDPSSNEQALDSVTDGIDGNSVTAEIDGTGKNQHHSESPQGVLS